MFNGTSFIARLSAEWVTRFLSVYDTKTLSNELEQLLTDTPEGWAQAVYSYLLDYEEVNRILIAWMRIDELSTPKAKDFILSWNSDLTGEPITYPPNQLACWLFLEHPELFNEAYWHYECEQKASWVISSGQGLTTIRQECEALIQALYTPMNEALKANKQGELVHIAHHLNEGELLLDVFYAAPPNRQEIVKNGKREADLVHPAKQLFIRYAQATNEFRIKTPTRLKDLQHDVRTAFATTLLNNPKTLEECELRRSIDLSLLKTTQTFTPGVDDPFYKITLKMLCFSCNGHTQTHRHKEKLELILDESLLQLIQHPDTEILQASLTFACKQGVGKRSRTIDLSASGAINTDLSDVDQAIEAYLSRHGFF